MDRKSKAQSWWCEQGLHKTCQSRSINCGCNCHDHQKKPPREVV